MIFAKETLTLVISGDGVRVALARGRQIIKWGARPLQAGLTRDGLVTEVQAVGKAIARFLDEERLPRRRVAAAITGVRAISRILTLPKMHSSLLASTVSREAKRTLPVPLEEVYLSWQALRESGAQIEVFLVAVPRETVDSAVQALYLAGVRPHVMDLKPLALGRAVNRGLAIVADFEPECLEMTILLDNVPVVMRSVTLLGGEQEQPDGIARLVNELVRTVHFYNDSHKEEPLPAETPIYLCGSLADNQELRDAVAGNLDYPLLVPEPPFSYPPTFPVSLYLANLGLAMKQF